MTKVLDNLMWNDPMRWQGLIGCDLDTNIEALKAFRTWLFFTPMEREIFKDDYPEFTWLVDDELVKEMRHDLLATLN